VSKLRLTLAAAIVVLATAWWSWPYVSAAAFVIDLSGTRTWVRALLPVRSRNVITREVEVPTRHGAIAARLYQPDVVTGRSVLVFPGIHAGGLDEPRLVAFSRRLAATGVRVVSVPLPELRRYRITPASTDAIEDAALWMAADRALAPDGRVDIAAVSFAGGLALVAAGRPSLDGKIATLLTLGSHADLPRTMTYLCTGQTADGATRPPHDYGVAIILLGALPRLVPPEQVPLLRETILAFLDASSETSTDEHAAEAMFAAARRKAAELPEPAKTLAALVNDRNVAALGARLRPFVEELGGDPALSPDRSPATHARTFLLHGSEDNVIPASETPAMAAYLRAHGNDRVVWLLTPLVSHASVQTAGAGEAWRLIRFWKDALMSR